MTDDVGLGGNAYPYVEYEFYLQGDNVIYDGKVYSCMSDDECEYWTPDEDFTQTVWKQSAKQAGSFV